MASPATGSMRRYDLDAIRVVAFGLLIPYHTSMIFGSMLSSLKADEPSRLFDLLELASHPWRMMVVFLLSGVTTAIMARKRPIGALWMARTKSILTPFVFGMLFFGAPQAHVVNRLEYGLDVHFARSWMASFGLGPRLVDGQILANGSLYHLWFLLYLWAYVSIWLWLAATFPSTIEKLRCKVNHSLDGLSLFAIPIFVCTVCRVALYPVFGETLNFCTDAYYHVMCASAFVVGYMIAHEEVVWVRFERARRLALALALIALIANIAEYYLAGIEKTGDVNPVLRSVLQWCAVVAIFGYGRAYLSRRNGVIAYLNGGVLTYYLTQQVIIIYVGYWFHQAGMLQSWSFVPITLITFVACAAVYDVERRLRKLNRDVLFTRSAN